MSPRLDSRWSGSFSLPGRELHPLEAPGLAWRSEETLDVKVEYPIVPPAALARRAHGVDRRAAGTVSVGVCMEQRIQTRLQVPADNLLRDPVRHHRDGQRPRP